MQWRWFWSAIKTLRTTRWLQTICFPHAQPCYYITENIDTRDINRSYFRLREVEGQWHCLKHLQYTEEVDLIWHWVLRCITKSLTLAFPLYIQFSPLKTQFSSYGLAILDARKVVLTPSEYIYGKLLLTRWRALWDSGHNEYSTLYCNIQQLPTRSAETLVTCCVTFCSKKISELLIIRIYPNIILVGLYLVFWSWLHPRLVKKHFSCCEILTFIVLFTGVHHWSLP